MIRKVVNWVLNKVYYRIRCSECGSYDIVHGAGMDERSAEAVMKSARASIDPVGMAWSHVTSKKSRTCLKCGYYWEVGAFWWSRR